MGNDLPSSNERTSVQLQEKGERERESNSRDVWKKVVGDTARLTGEEDASFTTQGRWFLIFREALYDLETGGPLAEVAVHKCFGSVRDSQNFFPLDVVGGRENCSRERENHSIEDPNFAVQPFLTRKLLLKTDH